MSDSWESFAEVLLEETTQLRRVNDASEQLTRALVANDPVRISSSERVLDEARKAFSAAAGRRRGMQVRGFGTMTLRQVCAYAPRELAPTLNQRFSELATGSISLRITTSNNKALIASGLERLMKITAIMQRAASDQPGTYKRRGFVPPPTNSVLVSSSA